MNMEKRSGESIPLSREFGVNPTLAVCYFCGEDTGEIALLGRNYKVNGREAQAPHKMIVNDNPCPACASKILSGEWVAFDAECGHRGLVKRSALEEMLPGQVKPEWRRVRFEVCPQCAAARAGAEGAKG